MNNPRLAIRYAKSLIGIATEKGKLGEVYEDMKFLQTTCKDNPEFVALLSSPVIDEHKKNNIIKAITTGRVSELTATFIKLLTSKSRESNLTEIIAAYIDQYNELKGIHKARLTTATSISDTLKQDFISKIKSSNNISTIELETVVDERLIGGFVLEMDGKLLDASILRDLKDVKKQFQNNDYIHKLR